MKQIKIILPLLIIMLLQYWYFSSQIESLRANSTEATLQVSTQPRASIKLPAFSRLAEDAQPSVVSIDVYGVRSQRRPEAMGSGFVLSEDGFLLTNNHVIDGAESITVKFSSGKEFDATLVGSDSETDIALLKIEASGLRAFEFGDVNQTKVGSWVVAIGAPFGFEQTVTAGIISAKGRSVGEQYVPYLQTDVAINMGNSGGPLINMDGKVIGVNSKIISTDGGSVGLSFAIPIDLALDVISQLKEFGKVKRGFLGVGYQEVTREIAESFKLQNNHGALVNNISANSPADKAGLELGDIVTAVDGKTIFNYTELPFLVGRLRPGMKTELSIIRDGETKQLELTIGSREPRAVAGNRSPEIENPPVYENSLQIQVIEIPSNIKQNFDIRHGVLVESVDDGPAQLAGIAAGDIILSIQTKAIDSVEEFESIVQDLPADEKFVVLVTRPGQGTRFIPISLAEQ